MSTLKKRIKNAFGKGQAGPRITCSGLGDLVGAWLIGLMVVAAAWIFLPQLRQNLWQFPLPFPVILYGPLVLAALISLLAAFFVLRATLRWRILGPATFTMDPWPANAGGELGGTILLATRPTSRDRIVVSLQCVHRERRGVGRNARWHETVLWKDEGQPVIETDSRGARLVVRFQLPDGQPESQRRGREQIRWRLSLDATINGRPLRRGFVVPVGDGAARNGSLTRYPLTSSRPA